MAKRNISEWPSKSTQAYKAYKENQAAAVEQWREAFPVGSFVTFLGTRDEEDGHMNSAGGDGTDVFVARVANYPYGLCISLEWPDGSPVGIPFQPGQLTLLD